MKNELILNVGVKRNWNEIKVGEVFAGNGCWNIGYKISKKEFIYLGTDRGNIFISAEGDLFTNVTAGSFWFSNYGDFYKLPESVQELWLTK